MKFIYTLKITADICFYLTFANFIAVAFGIPISIIAAPPIAYIIYSIITFRKFTKTSHFDYETIFILYLKLFLPFAFFAIIFAYPHFESASLPFALAFFITAIFLMRMTRQPPQIRNQMRYKLMNLIPITAIFMLVLAITSRQFLGLGGIFLYELYFNVILPILMFLGMAIAFILYPLVYWLSQRPESTSIMEQMAEGEAEYFNQPGVSETAAAIADGLQAIFILGLILLAAFLFIKLFRKLTEYYAKSAAAEDIGLEYLPVSQHKPAKIQSKGKARQLRKYYHKFLQFCWKNGIPNEQYMTSADYERLSASQFGLADEAAQLRGVYLPVR
ncbi:MAG: hypothetical protein FWD03_06885, partial [Defluviitaleaceae bacterium]|nr:hypothetical protein [Defluviitaleaceae bacterium]